MLDDLFDHIDFDSPAPRRAQTIFRILFGVIGIFLAAAGFAHVLVAAKFSDVGLMLKLAMANLFLFLGFFCAFNIALHKPWSWPGRGFLASLVLLIVIRLVFGR